MAAATSEKELQSGDFELGMLRKNNSKEHAPERHSLRAGLSASGTECRFRHMAAATSEEEPQSGDFELGMRKGQEK